MFIDDSDSCQVWVKDYHMSHLIETKFDYIQ